MRFSAVIIALLAYLAFFVNSIALANGIALPSIAISTAAPASLGGVNFENDALVAYDPTTNVAQQIFNAEDAFSDLQRNVDAAHILSNGNVVISTQSSGSAGGVSFKESDLLLLDLTNDMISLFFDADAEGLNNIGSVPNINAVHIREENNNILFSTGANSGVEFKGTNYTKGDIIEYDPTAGTGSLLLSGSLFTGEPGFEPDLLGFAVIDDDHILIAANDEGADGPLTLGGVSFTRDDLVLYNPTNDTSTLYMNGFDEFTAPGEIIDAVTVAVIPEPASLVILTFLGVALLSRRRGNGL